MLHYHEVEAVGKTTFDYFETSTRSCVMTHSCEYLRNEDKRLVRLDNETETRRHNMRTG
ncbi:hypothetical protein M405DRAFT_815768 [Rhizopogon salebrosus TDB-379]|nr:hypothetical protein M405DRAFT_815768 [Rhizopogon salebrosus TDB-379]